MPPWGRTLRVARGKGARSRRSRGLGARPPPAPSLSVSRAPWAGCGSRCGAWLTLSVFLWASVDPTLRRLRAPLSGSTLKVRPQGGFGRYAPGGRRGAVFWPLGASRCGCSGEAALQGRHCGDSISVLDSLYGWFEATCRDAPRCIRPATMAARRPCRKKSRPGARMATGRLLLTQHLIYLLM